MTFGSSCFKCLFSILNLAFALCGFMSLIIGVIVHFDTLRLGREADIISISSISYTRLLIIGLTLMTTAVFGYSSMKRKNRCMITTYTLLILLILLIIRMKKINGEDIQKHYREMTFENYRNQADYIVSSQLDDPECCGINGSNNSMNQTASVNNIWSCCSPTKLEKQQNCSSVISDIYLPGCSSHHVEEIIIALGILETSTYGSGFAVIIFVALALCSSNLRLSPKREVYKVCDMKA